ncbi:hypothetical protein G7Y89_g2890 [Cudoniella acicularis]|uniref:Uncharacterized protein n=1 Tax=Cudoniella acicularis TaxID=354080 RepID=A0A8H4RTN2_9HELO|nr:hypothetical protein G7Y89_g2890 [Cudoniella acicularis]
MNTPIHPLYARSKWRESDILVGHGFSGNWSGSNDAVWKVFELCLRLATRFLANTNVWSWFNALVFGERIKLLRDSRIVVQTVPNTVGQDISKFLVEIAEMAELSFGIPENAHGMTWSYQGGPDKKLNDVHICLRIHLIEPLLRLDLTVSERLIQPFRVMKTLLHETSHALGWYVAKDFEQFELFFEDELIAEVGCGAVLPWPLFITHIPAGLTHRVSEIGTKPVQELSMKSNSTPASRDDKSKKDVVDVWSMTVCLIENPQNVNYWDCAVRRFEREASENWRIFGIRNRRDQFAKGRMISTRLMGSHFEVFTEEYLYGTDMPVELRAPRGMDFIDTDRHYVRTLLEKQHLDYLDLMHGKRDLELYELWKNSPEAQNLRATDPQKYQEAEQKLEGLRKYVERTEKANALKKNSPKRSRADDYGDEDEDDDLYKRRKTSEDVEMQNTLPDDYDSDEWA